MQHPQYLELRDLAFSFPVKPESPGEQTVQVLIADWHRGNGIITLVLTIDGAVSLYFSNGSSVIGSGKFPAVSQAAEALMHRAQQSFKEGQQVSTHILPDTGQLQFFCRTANALFWLPAGADPSQVSATIIDLFNGMNEVIACIRETNQQG